MASEDFILQERGLVEMKGKGKLRTFWLEASQCNELVNSRSIVNLQDEVQDMMDTTISFDKNVENMLENSKMQYNNDSQSKMDMFTINRDEPSNTPTLEIGGLGFGAPRMAKANFKSSASVQTTSTVSDDSSTDLAPMLPTSARPSPHPGETKQSNRRFVSVYAFCKNRRKEGSGMS